MMGFGPARKGYRYRNNRHSNRWRQIGISACVLFMPPIAIGATAYTMLPPRPDRPVIEATAPNRVMLSIQAHAAVAPAAAPSEAPPAAPELAPADQAMPQPAPQPRRNQTGSHPMGAQKFAEPDRPRNVMHSASSSMQSAPGVEVEGNTTASAAAAPANGTDGHALAEAGHQPTQKDWARVAMGPVPVHVMVVTAPNAARAVVAGTPSSTPAPATPPMQPLADAPPEPSGLTADLAAEAQGLRSARSHFRSYIRHLAHRSSTVRAEVRAARSQPKSQPEFSLRGFLERLGGTRQRDSQRADASGGRSPPR
jgi:hypothetical protein